MNIISKIIKFYYEGFRSMTIGRTLWAIIIIKLIIMFAILRLFFFPNFLKQKAETPEQKSNYVTQQLIERSQNPQSRN